MAGIVLGASSSCQQRIQIVRLLQHNSSFSPLVKWRRITGTPVFIKCLKANRTKTDTKTILLMDDNKPVYGIGMPEIQEAESSSRWSLKGLLPKSLDKDIGQVYRYDQSGGRTLIGEIKWVGELRDKWRWNGWEWKPLKDVWDRFSQLKEIELYCDKFVGSDGRNYIWFLDGYRRVLCQGSKSNAVLAIYVDEGTDNQVLWLTKEAYAAGDMLFVTLMTSEGFGARIRFQAPVARMDTPNPWGG
ncbi:hypothetical protein CPB86DRAFT_780068 [Serendipita vermifera]|nr:hypothetical protein CPB86DRAFT_780068 [Serendipita vermifera]